MSRFLCAFLFVEVLVCGTKAAITFATAVPTLWTNTYVAMVPEIDPESENAGQLFIMSSKNVTTDVWLNAVKQTKEYSVIEGQISTATLSANSLMPAGPGKLLYGYSVISEQSLGILFRNKWTFFQLRADQQLSKDYMAVTYDTQTPSMISVICVCAMFDQTTVTFTFRDGINVTQVAGNVTSKLFSISGQRAIFTKLSNRYVLKLESHDDLSGTTISSTEEIAFLSGSISSDAPNGSVYFDHGIGADDTDKEYIVWGLPNIFGSDVCRIIAQSPDTNIIIDGNEQVSLSNKGDNYDFNISRHNFTHINATSPVVVAMLIDNGDEGSSDMVIALPIGYSKTSSYTFSIPTISTDKDVQHYVVITTKKNGINDMKLNGEDLSSEVEWIAVADSDYRGTYIPLSETTAKQSIANTKDIAFNAYLLGVGDNVTYGSALVSTSIPKPNTDHLNFSLERTFCERTNQVGNYISGDVQMEVSTLETKTSWRKVSYNVKHFHTAHAQACQLNCFLYKDCIGVNFNHVITNDDVNCDVIMSGNICAKKIKGWTTYTLK